jgi:hypothetical protein
MRKGVDPIRFLDLTYPQVICILTEDDEDKADSLTARAKKVMKDFKGGKYRTES